MAQSDTVVCENCAAEVPRKEAPGQSSTCAGNIGGPHNWSEADPLSRLLARFEHSDESEPIESNDNDNWQWVEVRLVGLDEQTASEIVADLAQREGFSFIGIGDGVEHTTLRFNKKKGAADE